MRAETVQRTPQDGFTLLEVMVAMAILAVGLSAVVTVFSRATASVSHVEAVERAGMEAQMRMDAYLNGTVDPPDTRGGTCDNLTGATWQVRATKDPHIHGVSVVEVQVDYTLDGRRRSLRLQTAQADLSLPRTTTTTTTGTK